MTALPSTGLAHMGIVQEYSLRGFETAYKYRKVPPASPVPSSMWLFAGISCGRRYGRLSPAMEGIPTALESTARLSTA
jgi:hypothetical protein